MTFEWTPHRFSGGALALDVANSVILRHDPLGRIDRFADPADLSAFVDAAARLSADRPARGKLLAPEPVQSGLLIDLRESIDRHFRAVVLGQPDATLLAAMLEACATALRAGADPSGHMSLLGETATSALALLSANTIERIRICRHCGWLFVDRSKNRSRNWCDMSVCGNRVKAARHYRKQKGAPT